MGEISWRGNPGISYSGVKFFCIFSQLIWDVRIDVFIRFFGGFLVERRKWSPFSFIIMYVILCIYICMYILLFIYINIYLYIYVFFSYKTLYYFSDNINIFYILLYFFYPLVRDLQLCILSNLRGLVQSTKHCIPGIFIVWVYSFYILFFGERILVVFIFERTIHLLSNIYNVTFVFIKCYINLTLR